jgi:cob(I)alamin adenosyltransferase
MRLDKIYTKIGDGGKTLLANGERIDKSAQRIEAYGAVDELNAFLGLLVDELAELKVDPQIVNLRQACILIQNELFDLGGELATPSKSLNLDRQKVVGDTEIQRLELEMDEWTSSLPPLQNFVLPGGLKANSLAHVCRTVARRAEREIVRLSAQEEIRRECQIYVNRLSDWFFLASRFISKVNHVPEELWKQKR